MHKMRCIAIDDEPLALKVIVEFSKQISDIILLATFTNPLEARAFMENEPVDLLFLDINMLEVNGIAFAKALHVHPLLIFTTAHREYALDGFELNAVDYLLKPFNFDRFRRAVDKALRENMKIRSFIVVFEEYARKKVYLDMIEYIESMQDYLIIHLIDQTKIMTLGTLKSMEDKLPKDKFARIHRSYLVAVDCVREIHQRKVILPHIALNIGDTFYKDVKHILGG